MASLLLVKTERFSVLEVKNQGKSRTSVSSCKGDSSYVPRHFQTKKLPIITLADLLLHKERNTTGQIRHQLMLALKRHGFCFLRVSQTSQPGQIVETMRRALAEQLFPNDRANNTIPTSDVIYVSERGVPMWKLGYELSEDGIREFFRIHAGCPDDQPWPETVVEGKSNFRSIWLKGLALCRHICDEALSLCIDASVVLPRQRSSSGIKTWLSSAYCQTPPGELPDRPGDFSVLYAMHYFNKKNLGSEADDDCTRVNVKQHVDPSLFVLEPFLVTNCSGLQVQDQATNRWLDCDGPTSPLANMRSNGDEFMCLFIGRGFARHCPGMTPTLHRVVAASHQSRRSIIYEQKYDEYWD